MNKKIKTAAAALLFSVIFLAPAAPAQASEAPGFPRVELKTEILGRLGLSRQPQAASAKAAFNRLTNVAGMFMGRVDVASVGSWRVKLILELK